MTEPEPEPEKVTTRTARASSRLKRNENGRIRGWCGEN